MGAKHADQETTRSPKPERNRTEDGEKFRSWYYKLVNSFILTFTVVCVRYISRQLTWNMLSTESPWQYFSLTFLTHFPVANGRIIYPELNRILQI